MTMTGKVTIQRGASLISVEGTDEFIKKTLAEWKHLLDNGSDASVSAASPSSPVKPQTGSGDGIAQYENVFDTVDGKLKLIHSMPGGNKADKTRSTALSLLYGYYVNGSEQIASELIREACMDQGCFDSSNFASHLKGLKEKVAMNTKSGGGYEVKLTAPGRKAAKELVENLNSAHS
jgi:hypothetical protein